MPNLPSSHLLSWVVTPYTTVSNILVLSFTCGSLAAVISGMNSLSLSSWSSRPASVIGLLTWSWYPPAGSIRGWWVSKLSKMSAKIGKRTVDLNPKWPKWKIKIVRQIFFSTSFLNSVWLQCKVSHQFYELLLHPELMESTYVCRGTLGCTGPGGGSAELDSGKGSQSAMMSKMSTHTQVNKYKEQVSPLLHQQTSHEDINNNILRCEAGKNVV